MQQLYKHTIRDYLRFHANNSKADSLLEPNDYETEIKAAIEGELEYTANYCSYLVQYLLRTFCCCLKWCFRKGGYCESRMSKYRKFEKALERLADESDIIRLIRLNRVSRLLHKVQSSSN